MITVGKGYRELREGLERLKEMGFGVEGFGDMTAREIAERTGLNLEEARLAKRRDFDEPFFVAEGTDEEALLAAIRSVGLEYTIGRYYHLTGGNDKGKAVRLLEELFRAEYGDLMTVGIGDSLNDLPMLKVVDLPVIVMKPDRTYDEKVSLEGLVKADGIGPDGWSKAVLRIIGN